jgi:hypothetical protein
MPHETTMRRRTFLAATAALAASCSRMRNGTARLGTLAYVDAEDLWLRPIGVKPARRQHK